MRVEQVVLAQTAALDHRTETRTGRQMQAAAIADGAPRVYVQTGNVLGNESTFVLPQFYRWAGDGRLQVAPMVMFGVPGTGRLMKPA